MVSVRAAARRASPGSKSREGPHSTFSMALQRDPAFAAAAHRPQPGRHRADRALARRGRRDLCSRAKENPVGQVEQAMWEPELDEADADAVELPEVCA